MNLQISAYTQGSGGAQLALTRVMSQKISAVKDYKLVFPITQEEMEPLDIEKAVKDLERISSTLNKKLKFIVDHKSSEILVKVIDPETGEVVNILPPKELRRLHSKITESIGVLFDELI
ncbi:MAG: flagellar protein FlaG [Treponema sp.]|jgi:flagellar protein FlaG|nr:flagellar protein FlaG [Treponema sp.]